MEGRKLHILGSPEVDILQSFAAVVVVVTGTNTILWPSEDRMIDTLYPDG